MHAAEQIMSKNKDSAQLCMFRSQLSQRQIHIQRMLQTFFVSTSLCVTCNGVVLDMLDGKGVKIGGCWACCAQQAIQSTACKARGSIHAAALLSCFTDQQCLHVRCSL